jgi:probable O-glycosylation ligase (exosortase A-associated)
MRDIIVTLLVFGALPFIFKRPYFGVLMWVWISVMNPHTQSWGFAATFPFAAMIAGITILSLIFTREPKSLPNTSFTWMLFAILLWMTVTTALAFQPEESLDMWNKVMKTMLMTFVTLMLIKTKEQVQLLIWTIVISLGYYGVKGGIFTIKTGGTELVWGPGNTFIGGNNEIALALIMTIPLMHYLQMVTQKKWVHRSLTVAMSLCAVAAIGTYSRGALLAILAMGGVLWWKSQHKARIGMLILLATPLVLVFMPDKWGARMDTINTYEQDESAQGRINAWRMTYNLAKDRPLVGGGFEIYDAPIFSLYAPDPTNVKAAHSIYFQALGEHGFVGLGLFLLLGIITWRSGAWIIRNTEKMDEYRWASDLARMIQVSLVGYAVGGAFLSLLYFDVPYYLMAAMLITRVLVSQELRQQAAPKSFRKPNAPIDPRPRIPSSSVHWSFRKAR